tara:strand:+ start:66 stop:488 length:423 start_codon:yes stop_codon:yes gene_type:complete
MPYTKRTDGKYNRQAQYFLISVKERNMDEFLDTLKKERKRHAEPKADRIIPLGRHKNESFEAAYDFAKIFYDLNNLNQEASGKYHIKRIKDFIKSEMDEYYESSEIPKRDITDFYDAIDEVWEIIDKQKKERLQQSQQQQ